MRRAIVITKTRKVLRVVVAALGLGAQTVPAAVAAPAEQIVETLVDEPVTWEFDDPCTGDAIHSETGLTRPYRIRPGCEAGAFATPLRAAWDEKRQRREQIARPRVQIGAAVTRYPAAGYWVGYVAGERESVLRPRRWSVFGPGHN